MLIQCTKKLLERLNRSPYTVLSDEKLSPPDPVFHWHANLITISRRNVVVLVNDRNRYVVVLHGLKSNDFKKMVQIIPEAIRQVFRAEMIKEELIDTYLEQAGKIVFTKTRDRSSVSVVNNICQYLQFEDEFSDRTIYQVSVSTHLSRGPVSGKSVNKNYIFPYKQLLEDMRILAKGGPVFSRKAIQLKVTLDLSSQKVWRRLIVPAVFNFRQLHEILQTAFGWQNTHLHEFYIYGDQKISKNVNSRYMNHTAYHKKGFKPVLKIVDDEIEEFEDVFILDDAQQFDPLDCPEQLETLALLADYVTENMKYVYDYGDFWEHYLETERWYDDYEGDMPLCIDGAGNAPPEDVGGEGGFDHFLKIVSDRSNPEFEEMLRWAKFQGYADFDIKSINLELEDQFR